MVAFRRCHLPGPKPPAFSIALHWYQLDRWYQTPRRAGRHRALVPTGVALEMREFLASNGTVLKAEMQNRPEYISTMLYGRVVVDDERSAGAKEIAAIFSELEQQFSIKRKPAPKARGRTGPPRKVEA